MNQAERRCSFCNESRSNYSCPKCGQFYCSVTCYKSEKHLNCTELFYKKCVEDELRLQSRETNDETKKRTLEIIKREYANLVGEEEQDFDFDEMRRKFDKLHLKSETDLWSNLDEVEKENFKKLLKQNEIINLLPVDCWTPWYLKQLKSKCLIEELDDLGAKSTVGSEDDLKTTAEFIKQIESDLNESNFNVPQLSRPIKRLDELTKVKPSPYVKCTVINILFAYCYVCRYFNNEHLHFLRESFELIDRISLLNQNKTVFTSTRQSVQFTIQLLINDRKVKTEFILILIDDLKFILENENHIYLYILSDLIRMVKMYKRSLKRRTDKKDFELKRLNDEALNDEHLDDKARKRPNESTELSALLKRLEYYLSFLNENRDCLIEQISEIVLESAYLLEMKNSIDKQLEDKKDEIRIY